MLFMKPCLRNVDKVGDVNVSFLVKTAAISKGATINFDFTFPLNMHSDRFFENEPKLNVHV